MASKLLELFPKLSHYWLHLLCLLSLKLSWGVNQSHLIFQHRTQHFKIPLTDFNFIVTLPDILIDKRSKTTVFHLINRLLNPTAATNVTIVSLLRYSDYARDALYLFHYNLRIKLVLHTRIFRYYAFIISTWLLTYCVMITGNFYLHNNMKARESLQHFVNKSIWKYVFQHSKAVSWYFCHFKPMSFGCLATCVSIENLS